MLGMFAFTSCSSAGKLSLIAVKKSFAILPAPRHAHLVAITANRQTLEKFYIPRGINESAKLRFLQRLSVIFSFLRDCPRSLASCRDCYAW